MRTAIIAAMEEEVQYLRQQIHNHESFDFQGYTYHIGDIMGQSVVLVQSGIGKVNAAMSSVLLLEHFSVSEVINTGSAGSLDASLAIGDVIVANEAVYNDVDVTTFGYTYGQVPQMPETFVADKPTLRAFTDVLEALGVTYEVGMIASGDQFVHGETQVAAIRAVYPQVRAVDMEATAIAQVCYQYMIPATIVRSISDIIIDKKEASNADFKKYIDTAARNSSAVIIEYLRQKSEREANEG